MTFGKGVLRLAFLITAGLGLAGTGAAAPATYPSRPIQLIVGFAPGGAADTVARAVAEQMAKALGQPVVIDNRSGASGNIATQTALAAPADGYSVIFAAIHLATNPSMIGVPYNPRTDIAMVGQMTSVPVLMLAAASSPYKTAADVVAASRRTDGGLRVGSGGIGTSSHLALELFKRAEHVPALHVPYRGGTPALQGLMSGEVDVMFDLGSGTLKSYIEAGKVRPLAVMQAEPVASIAAPTAQSAGLPKETYIRSWQGLAVKAGTPPQVIARLHDALNQALQQPAVRARVQALGMEVKPSAAPADFQKLYVDELDRWSALIKSANIKPQ